MTRAYNRAIILSTNAKTETAHVEDAGIEIRRLLQAEDAAR